MKINVTDYTLNHIRKQYHIKNTKREKYDINVTHLFSLLRNIHILLTLK